MKTLKSIQTIAKVGGVLCKIINVLSLVGMIACAVALVLIGVMPESLRIGGLTVKGIIESVSLNSMGTIYASLSSSLVLLGGQFFMSKYAMKYISNEMEAGTPFTFEGAKELKELGIKVMCITAGTGIFADIVHTVFERLMNNVRESELHISLGLTVGAVLVAASLIFKYGAEIIAANGECVEEENEENIEE